MADCKAKYRNAVHQFIRLVSVDAKAYMTFIKQVKEISLQYQTDLILDDDEDDDPGDRSGKRKKDDDPDYRPSKKQLKKADK